MKPKSLVSFLRKELQVRGDSPHSGRGTYDMDAHITWRDLHRRIINRLPRWQERGLIEKEVMVAKDRVEILFTKKVFDKNYRYFFACEEMSDRFEMMQVHCYFDPSDWT